MDYKSVKIFIDSLKKMISKKISINGEYYVGPTYNYMIKDGLEVGHYHLRPNIHFSLGTLEDLNFFINYEYCRNKNQQNYNNYYT